MKKNFKKTIAMIAVVALIFAIIGPLSTRAAGPIPANLLTAGNFAILSKAGITNTGGHTTMINGDIGSSPITATAMNDVFCSEINGTIYGVNAAYVGSGDQSCYQGNPPLSNKTLVDDAIIDMAAAYTALETMALPDETERNAGIIGGETFIPGLYKWSTDVSLASDITLSGGANDVWIFQIAGNLNLASAGDVPSGVKVLLSGGAQAKNVYWQVGGLIGATLGTYSTFNGNILTAKQIIIQTGAILNGRALAQTQVTLDANSITTPGTGNLNVIKVVVNDNTGTKTANQFNLTVKRNGVNVAGSPALGAGSPGTAYTLSPSLYTVSETADPMYTVSFSGDCDATGKILVTNGSNMVCTVTNNDIDTASITVVKTVINDSGRNKVVSDFPLFVNGSSVSSGVTNAYTAPATYTVTETTDPNYTSSFSGDCNASGVISLVPDMAAVCVITNNDIGQSGGGMIFPPAIPPFIDVVKVPSVFSIPNGPGNVLYTYTVRNIGTVPMTNITMVGDTCSPIVLISGDTNNDAKLDVNETWVHTCTSTLYATHTNTVVATGWANSISAIDVASATVVVGAPVVAPLIHLTKVPSKPTMTAPGGIISFAYAVTNPGTVALSNLTVSDDKCSPVQYVSGDSNLNGKLEATEAWSYSCRSMITKTTTNTATASGQANGLTVRDVAIANVIVSATTATPTPTPTPTPGEEVIPKLPNTGLAPDTSPASNNILLMSGLSLVALTVLAFGLNHKFNR
jgi:hypothetical protein